MQFTKRKGKLWTFTYPNGVRAQLDHIMINKKWRNSALNCEAYGIPDTMAQVLSPDGDTESFKILAGVLQGDTLSPFLFIVALDYAMRIATSIPPETGFTLAPCRSKHHQAIIITDTDFADDIALISDNLEKAQLLLLRVEIAVDIIGLHVNEKKTEFMIKNDVNV